ncbi:hypothetical protein GCM10009555_079990 [Acrocarpospora macrocephala]|uniref:histidine kinase n=1 Tax=Acrocarpospora macrocephala TaxID=150177 RepID=A0A5M3X707_9ACTN|nr:histidine kinase dimerization/phosphoacceptor domain-containing protein [Acrocarpospora macrocephala]GES16860.1 hypothetical protein Amac_104580 [Acrocarpospora macrocephala]
MVWFANTVMPLLIPVTFLGRLDEVRASRARIVEAGVAERRRVERDLHDGAQQRLLALAATLGRVRSATGDPAVHRLVDEARAGLRDALAELRDLARGIHPAVLEQIGRADRWVARPSRAISPRCSASSGSSPPPTATGGCSRCSPGSARSDQRLVLLQRISSAGS